ncbi:MAG TPA: alpha/beta hydrolase [Clostridiales bacterium]|nr:alpha/beta hydrolase [Clostridiales bacterium]
MDIRCTQSIYPSACAGASISYYILRPVGVELRGIVQICHGMCEYFTRYTAFAKYLCSLGYIVCGNDHLGHGASVPPSGALGFFGQHNGWNVLVEDVGKLTELMKSRWPDLPYFLLGHSMGSMVARLYLARCKQGDLDGCILSGCPGPNAAAGFGVQLAGSVIRSHGPMYRSGLLSGMAFRHYNARIPDCQSPFDWLTRDRSVVALYQSDAKCNFIFTASGFRDLFRLVQYSNRLSCARSAPHDVPLLLIAGDADPVGGYGSGVRKVAATYRAAGFRNLEVIFYKDCRHEVLNEINREEVYGDISRWLEQQLSARASLLHAQQS